MAFTLVSWPLLVVIAAVLGEFPCAQGFLPTPVRTIAPTVSSCYRRKGVRSSRRGDASTEVAPYQDVKTAAVNALEKLARQQKSELDETERLLSLLKDSSADEFDFHDISPQDRSLSTAASIVSGFDYGFVSRSEGVPSKLKGGFVNLAKTGYGGPPENVVSLSLKQFVRNWNAIRGEYADEADVQLTPQQIELQAKLRQLTLNSTAIWEREFANGPIDAPLILKIPYLAVCYLLDVVFEGRYVPSRFYLLETVARMPYFSYITMLHLYETLGFWRRSAEVKRIHFAEEVNEYSHLLIMESLGGDQRWVDRFIAQHSAIVYYLVLCFLFLASPTLSYRFSELLESHAVNTYSVLLDENKELLKELPPSLAAIEYYSFGASDPFYAEFQTAALSNGQELRRPGVRMTSLYDVFSAIRDDEGDHVQTMTACLDTNAALRSPSLEKAVVTGLALVATLAYLASMGGVGSSTLAETAASVDTAVGGATGLVDTLSSGVTRFAQQVMEDSEDRNLLNLGADLTEAGAVGAAATLAEKFRRFASELVGFLNRFL